MAGTIKHEWNGTVLTITSDAGTSSADLQGAVGDIGPRGPQGEPGIVVDENGVINLTGYVKTDYLDENYYTRDETTILITSLANFDDYYSKAEVDAKIPDVSGFIKEEDATNFITKEYVDYADTNLKRYVDISLSDVDLTGYATESFVTTKIAAAQLVNVDGSNIDLSGFRTLDNNRFNSAITLDDGANTLHLFPIGITGANGLWIGRDGVGQFTSLSINEKAVATQEYVDNAIAALDGSEVEY